MFQFQKNKGKRDPSTVGFPGFLEIAVRKISIHGFLSRFSRCEKEKTPSFTHHLLYMK